MKQQMSIEEVTNNGERGSGKRCTRYVQPYGVDSLTRYINLKGTTDQETINYGLRG